MVCTRILPLVAICLGSLHLYTDNGNIKKTDFVIWKDENTNSNLQDSNNVFNAIHALNVSKEQKSDSLAKTDSASNPTISNHSSRGIALNRVVEHAHAVATSHTTESSLHETVEWYNPIRTNRTDAPVQTIDNASSTTSSLSQEIGTSETGLAVSNETSNSYIADAPYDFLNNDTLPTSIGDKGVPLAHPATDYMGERFRLKLNQSKFPLPDWLDTFLNSQPIETHNKSIADPNQKFFVLTCHKFEVNQEEDCGGFSDRMKLLPYMLWVAKMNGRMLLIRYSKPYPLEEFLVPPSDGFDWRLPAGYFEDEFQAYANRTKSEYQKMRSYRWHEKIRESPWKEARVIFVNNNLAIPGVLRSLQEWTGFSNNKVMAGIFRRLFQPSRPVAEQIQSVAEEHGLIAGQYAGAHTRLKFPFKNVRYIWTSSKDDKMPAGLVMTNNMTKNNVQFFSHNALNCAMKIMPETKSIYFASDAQEAVAYLTQDSPWVKPTFAKASNSTFQDIPRVVVRPDFDMPFAHFDKSGDKPSPDGLYNIFVDLWILSHAKCISHGVGGYPRFAAQLTGNYETCRIKHRLMNSTVIYCPEYLHTLGVDFKSRSVIPEWNFTG